MRTREAKDEQPPVNPFLHLTTVPRDAGDWAKVALMSIFVAPIRLLLIGLVLVVAWGVACIGLFVGGKKPDHDWRRRVKPHVARLMVWAHAVAGFHRVKFKGERAPPWEAPILVAAPHTSFFDTLPFCALGAPSVVGKADLIKTPLIGRMLQLTEPILVDRDCQHSRRLTVAKIKERLRHMEEERDADPSGGGRHSTWPQILIFPEGTCTNQTQLLIFKPGAFYPRLPVQPVCIKWTKQPDLVSYTWEGTGLFTQLWLTCCQPFSALEIEFLPVHVPSEAERADPFLFAESVRQSMAGCLQIPAGHFAVDDIHYLVSYLHGKRTRFEAHCEKLSLPAPPAESGERWEALKRACACLTPSEAFLDFSQFAKYLRVEESSPALRRLFTMFDWECKGVMDLREFLVARFACSEEAYFRLCCSLFADATSGVLSEKDLVKILRMPFELSRKQVLDVAASVRRKGVPLTFENVTAQLEAESDENQNLLPWLSSQAN